MSVFSFFLGDGKTTWSYYQLYQKLSSWNKFSTFPYYYELPERIEFEYNFAESVKTLHRRTLKDGHERETSVYYVDNDIILTPEVRGERDRVTSRNSISVNYEPQGNGEYFEKRVDINCENIFKKTIYYKDLPDKIEIFRIFSAHTHPPHYDVNGNLYYNFLSDLDLMTYINSRSVCFCLINDKVNIFFKTSTTPKNVSRIDIKDININTIKEKLGIYTFIGDIGNIGVNKSNEY